MADTSPAEIVVGADGSESSKAALVWGALQAERTGASLVAVTAWHWPRSYGYPMPLGQGYDPQTTAEGIAETAAAAAREQHPGVDIRAVAVEGPAAQVLVQASEKASALVVGRHGHGEIAGMLLGSVSGYCAAHAHCPVVIVRHPQERHA
jgi:nucleotide-binding universal stress UspA family protein